MRKDELKLFFSKVARQKSIKLSNGQIASILVAKEANDANAVKLERNKILSYIKLLDNKNKGV